MSHNIEVVAGSSKKLLVGGKYCDRDIIVNGKQEAVETQEKTVEITENGTVEILPDAGKYLSKVTAEVSVASGEGGDTSVADAIIDRSIKEISSNAAIVGHCAFNNCKALTSVVFPNATSAEGSAFYFCSALTSIELPQVTSVGISAFGYCSALTSIELPKVTSVGASAFSNCSALTSIELPKVTSVGASAFNNCQSCLIYDFSGCAAVPKLLNKNAFTGINAAAKILVPGVLYNEWVAATNWATYADYIVAVGEVPIEYSEGLEFEIDTYNNVAYVWGIGTCTDSVVRIPPEYQGYPVKGIVNVAGVSTMVHLILPDTVTEIQSTCGSNSNLESVTFGSGLLMINYWAFNDNYKCKKYDFSRCTQVPYLAYFEEPGDSFSGMPSDCQIIVPASLYDAWVADTNWSYYANHIVAG